MLHLFRDQLKQKGIVERRLIDTRKLFALAQKFGVEFELSFDAMLVEHKSATFKVITLAIANKLGNTFAGDLIDKCVKSQFQDNALWKYIKTHFKKDLQIPFITGVWTKNVLRANLIVNTGHKKYADQVGGTTTAPVTAIALGTGTNAAGATDTALQTEITTNGGSRGAASVSNTTTTTTGDTEQWQKTFTFTGSEAVTEEGLLDNNTTGGILLARQVFSAVNVVNGDTLQITHKIQS